MKLMEEYRISELEMDGIRISHIPSVRDTLMDWPIESDEEIPEYASPTTPEDLDLALHNMGKELG